MSEEFYNDENQDNIRNEKREMMQGEDFIEDNSLEQENHNVHEYNNEETNNSQENNKAQDNTNYSQTNNSIENNSSNYSFWAEQVAANSATSNDNKEEQQDSQEEQVHASAYIPNDYLNVQNRQAQGYSGETGNNSTIIDLPINKKKHKEFKMFKKVVKFVLLAASFGLIAGSAFLGFNLVYYRLNPNAAPIMINLGDGFASLGSTLNINPSYTKIAATTVSQSSIQQKTDITQVVEESMPSIVTITSTFDQTYDWFGEEMDQENEGGGSGIIVGENDKELLIATNNHVVADAKSITINFIDGTKAKAVVKGTDTIADLAVVSIDKSALTKKTLAAIKIAKLGDSESVDVGQMAVAIGNALGYGQSVTVGYISAKDREVTVSDNKMVLLQTDAAINPGNSGGALLNLAGEVIGINSVKYASSEVEGMGYAIPISRAMPIINDLMSRETLQEDEKGYLGVYISDVTEEAAKMYNWPVGVYVTETAEGGSAKKAGIVAGDIITAVDGTAVTSGKQLQEKVNSLRVGTEIKITLKRSINGEFTEKEIKVTLSQKPKTMQTN